MTLANMKRLRRLRGFFVPSCLRVKQKKTPVLADEGHLGGYLGVPDSMPQAAALQL